MGKYESKITNGKARNAVKIEYREHIENIKNIDKIRNDAVGDFESIETIHDLIRGSLLIQQ
ncbi:MAG: hypothetical protein GXP19_07895 [Gammaproteobacteria bacterium]|nr:hypothetical protein [Gammaproteobacteria bacterium]